MSLSVHPFELSYFNRYLFFITVVYRINCLPINCRGCYKSLGIYSIICKFAINPYSFLNIFANRAGIHGENKKKLTQIIKTIMNSNENCKKSNKNQGIHIENEAFHPKSSGKPRGN